MDRAGLWALPGSANCLPPGSRGRAALGGLVGVEATVLLRRGRGQSQTPHLTTVGALPVRFFFLLNTRFLLVRFRLLCI